MFIDLTEQLNLAQIAFSLVLIAGSLVAIATKAINLRREKQRVAELIEQIETLTKQVGDAALPKSERRQET